MTRAVMGFSREISHSANASLRPDVRPLAGRSSVGGFPYVITLRNPGLVAYALLFGSPRTRKYDGGVSYSPGPGPNSKKLFAPRYSSSQTGHAPFVPSPVPAPVAR